MRKSNNQLVFSASDLSNHIHCKHLTNLNKEVVDGLVKKPVTTNKTLELLRERGLDFEDSYLQKLEQEHFTIHKINPENPKAGEETIIAMQKGFDYIYQGRLASEKWQGWADFLVKVDTPSDLGNWSYEVIDTKLSTQTRAGTILQIALYSEIVAEIQNLEPEYMHVKSPESEIKYRVSDYISYLRLTKKRLESALADPAETYPEHCSHCDICNWWEHCNSIRRKDDHLSFIAGMGTSQIKEVKAHGIETLDAMSKLALPLSFKPKKGSKETFVKLREQARLQDEVRLTNRPVYEILERTENTGFYNLPTPSKGDIYLDFEGDQFVETSGLEYLFGWVYQDNYYKIWVSDLEQEKAALEKFVDFIFEKRAEYPDLHIYHFAPYETIALKRMVGKYASKEQELDILLRSGAFIDLHRVLKQSIRAGVERYSLKDLERYHGYVREIDLRTVSKIKSQFEFLLESRKFDLITQEMKDAVQLYNLDDCFSTLSLHVWLEKERQHLIEAGEVIARPSREFLEEPESINAHLQRIKPLFDALMQEVPLEENDRTKTEQASYILAHFLDWYRREEKSFWWEYFRILNSDPDELLDEKSALTYLTFTGHREPVLRSVIDTYAFQSQECDLKAGVKLKDENGQSIGEIIEIDENRKLIRIKKGPSIAHNHPLTIIKFEQFANKEKVENIIRFAEWVVENGFDSTEPLYQATRDILRNTPPRLCSDLISTSDLVEKSKDWALKLNSSYLPIQGPPGAGKSFTASHMIYDLVKRGKKIGITALSHKVIINLLTKVKEVADENQFNIKILYKASAKSDEEFTWDTARTNDDVMAGLENNHVIAGTSFMWGLERFKNSLDYLFIDEAGQYSLIETTVVSHAAKNIVLLGDHQQLKQPIQGVHPEGTDLSALDHLLEGQKTIPENTGIFLEKTWRMHPDICAFDSEMFYEFKLKSVADLENQRLEGNTKFEGSGLFYVPVIHEGNTNQSAEEIECIGHLLNDLTKGDVYWYDKENKQQIIQPEHIKIITPYNSNVFELQSRFPNYQIGTVDKFQGQEAPIIIYSMASSTPEDAPRGMEFLYSPNRFNVAVSRAKIAFILVGSPKLFEPECKSPEQIKLANPFCRFMELAKNVEIIEDEVYQ